MNDYKEMKEYHKKLGKWLDYKKDLENTLHNLISGRVYIRGSKSHYESALNENIRKKMIEVVKEEEKKFAETSFEDWSKENE